MKKLLLSLTTFLFATLFIIGNLYAQDCPSSSGTTTPTDICGFFNVTLNAADCNAYGGEGGYLLYYDFDVSTTPTQMEIYDDLIGAIDLPDAAWLGESSFCDGAGFFDLEPIPIGCTVQDVALYIIPLNLVALTIDFSCPIEGPIISTVYPTFDIFLTQQPECDVPAIVELQGWDGSVCETLVGPTVTRPACTAEFGDVVNTETLSIVYDEAALAAISGGTPPAGCFGGGIDAFVNAECASFACEGGGCQLTGLELTGAACNNNGTPTDPSDDFYDIELTFNYADGTTYTVSDANSGAIYLSGQPYADPASQTETIVVMVPANGQNVVLTVTDDGDAACTISLDEIGPLVTCSDCTVFSGSSVTTPVCEGAVEGIFTVTVGNCDIAPGGIFTSALVMYDLDVTNTPPTDSALYLDIIGQVPVDDLIWFGEFGDCANSGGLSFLEGFENPSCTPLEIDLYLMPVDDAITTISFLCPIEGPIRLTTLPGQPTAMSTSCDGATSTSEVILGFDNGDGFGGAPDGDFDDPEDEICGTATVPVDGAGEGTVTLADVVSVVGGPGMDYTDAPCYTNQTVTCPCATVAPSVTIAGAACADGSTGAPYLVGDDGTGQSFPNDITEYIVVDDAAGTVTGVPGGIISIGSLAEAQAAVDAAPTGSEVCITAVVHNPTQLNQIFLDLNAPNCSNDLFSFITGITPPMQSLEEYYEGIVFAFNNLGSNPNLTLAEFEFDYLGGLSGEMVDVGELAGLPPGLIICNTPPYCYNFMPPTCVTIGDECTNACVISNLTVTPNACDDNGTPTDPSDDTYTVNISFDYSGAGATYTIDDSIATTNTYPTAGAGTVTINGYGSYPADGASVIGIFITDDDNPACAASTTFGPVMACSTIPNPMATISDPCNCINGIDLDGDGINDLAAETITITDPSGANQGWTLTANDNLVDADGTTPTTATVTDVGNATYTFTAYVVADGSTTYTAQFTAADGEVLTISGGPCNMCPPPLDEVPTVGEWGLIILALLMSITAVVGIRQRRREESII